MDRLKIQVEVGKREADDKIASTCLERYINTLKIKINT